MSLQNKLLISFLGLVLMPIIILGYVSYSVSSSALTDKVGNETLQTLQAIDLNLRTSLADVDSFSDYIISSTDIQEFLKTNRQQSVVDFYNKRQAITGLMYGQSRIGNLILYNKDGQTYHFRDTILPSYEEFQETLFYRLMKMAKGRSVWLSPIDEHPFSVDSKSFMLGRVVKDSNTLDNIGYLILEIKIEHFDNIFMSLHQGNSQEMIVNQQGKILYDRDHRLIGQTFNLLHHSKLLSGKQGTVVDYWHNKKSLITFIPTSSGDYAVSNSFLVSIKPWDVLSEETKYIRQMTILFVVAGVIFAILFNVLYVNKIVTFIREFRAKMQKVEHGDLSTRMSAFSFPELRKLASGFNRMVEEIVALLERVKHEQERKKKAEFQVLQSQINPHFLYNTLESINALAAMNGQKDISKMTINLGKLLRISINANDEVTVREEIQHVKSYMEIQKVRYDERFTFQVDVDERLTNYLTLKLILQPLVENILYHAFDRNQQNACITVRGEIVGEQGCFYIEDNGKGIRTEVLESFYKYSQGLNTNRENIGHGVMNVHDRLRIYYGSEYGLMICSMEGQGTIIKLVFPLYQALPGSKTPASTRSGSVSKEV